MIFPLSATSQSVDIQIVDDSGLAVTGLVAATFPTLTYSRAGANADVAFPALSDLAALTTAWASGGVKERGGGVYRLDVPDAIFSAAGVITIRGEASGKHVICPKIEVSVTVDSVTTVNGLGNGVITAASIAANAIDADALAADVVTDIWMGTALAESYASDGSTATPAQLLYMIWAAVNEFSISSTTITAKKLDGTTTAMTWNLDSSTIPTSRTRAT